MKTVQKILAFIVLFAFLPMTAFAHSGRTDSSGGHKDNKNKSGLGSYHYHCGGNPPHLHENGCPYATNASSSSFKSTPRPSPAERPTPKPVINKEVDEALAIEAMRDILFPIVKGDKSDWVKTIQERLIHLGYLFDTADGVFGEKTKAAVQYFQKDHGFEEDGIVTEETYKAIMYWEFEE